MRNRVIVIGGIILVMIAAVILLNFRNTCWQISQQQAGRPSQAELINQAKDKESKGQFLATRNTYQELVNNFPASPEVADWQKKVDDLNVKLLFSTALTPKSALYEVRPGDSLVKIANAFKTTPELIAKSNNITADKIFPGQRLKVWKAPLGIVVDKSQNILMLKSDEEVIKTYIVSTGANNSTPVGVFKIVNKLTNPTWFKAGTVVPAESPDNILGTRWLGFDIAGYGIHGTTEPEKLGKQVTQGCVRMANADVEELYIIVPVGTEVNILD